MENLTYAPKIMVESKAIRSTCIYYVKTDMNRKHLVDFFFLFFSSSNKSSFKIGKVKIKVESLKTKNGNCKNKLTQLHYKIDLIFNSVKVPFQCHCQNTFYFIFCRAYRL